MTKAGFVAIVGLPNAGKSSLLNRLLDQKLSIVTAAAQTTRERVVGIDTRDGVQMVFLDTPGIVDPAYLLHRSMLGIIEQTIEDADVVLLLLDGTRPPPTIQPEILAAILRHRQKLVVALNKIDAAAETRLEALRGWSEQELGRTPVRISARDGSGVEALRRALVENLPGSPFLYPEDEISSQPIRFFVAELIRETVFERYEEEVPYSTAVTIDEFQEDREPLFIRATVHVERASQKGILIGRGGEAIKRLGAEARVKIEQFLGRRIYLELWVKVLPKWRKKAMHLRRFGFPVPEADE